MGNVGKDLDVDFIVSTGDNFYDDGLTGVDDPAFTESFTNIYTAPSLQKPWYNGNFILYLIQYRDVDRALKESYAKWKFVIGHHTIMSAGHHGNTQELVAKLLPILEANNVDLYINGHDHCLEHISSPHSPLQFLTSGGGSKAWRGDVAWWDPKELKFYYDGQGFMSMQVTSSKLDVAFYDIFGNVLHKWSKNKSPNHLYASS
ncbi:hypothetical protein KSS87_023571 [Heliosperma pusillum]|nr:hypothetical protein KSS87_023571 [Heliosperma pusillum]